MAEGVDPEPPPRPRRVQPAAGRRRRDRRRGSAPGRRRDPERSGSHGSPVAGSRRVARRRVRGGRGGRAGRRRLRWLLGVLLGVLLLAGVVLLRPWEGVQRADRDPAEDLPVEEEARVPGEGGQSLALVTVGDRSGGSQVTRLSLLAHDAATDEATVLLVPTATVIDVPGHGTFPFTEVHDLGGADLVRLSLGNLLGVQLDTAAAITEQGWEQVTAELGAVEVTTPRTLTDVDGAVVAESGTSILEGAALARFLTAEVPGEGELDALSRVQQVMAALLDAVVADPPLADRLLALEGPDGAPAIATSEPALVAGLLRSMAAARSEEQLTTVTLPVLPVGTGADDGFRVDTARAEALVADRLAGSRPAGVGAQGRDVQILNGNGVPRIGREVAERLADGGYRVVLTGNADRFTYATTRIVLHDRSAAQLAVGRDVQERLGVGELELAATPGSVVDVTIVVGADFPPEDPSPG